MLPIELIDFFQKFFVFLLPGIVGRFIMVTVNIHKEQHYYFEILSIIVLSTLSYLIADGLFAIICLVWPSAPVQSIGIINRLATAQLSVPFPNVCCSCVLGIVLSCLLTKAVQEDWIFKFANRLKITTRSDDKPVWNHLFDQQSTIILRDTITQNVYFGSVIRYSDNSENKEILMSDVRVFNQESVLLYQMDRVYLSRKHDAFSIEIAFDAVEQEEKTDEESSQTDQQTDKHSNE